MSADLYNTAKDTSFGCFTSASLDSYDGCDDEYWRGTSRTCFAETREKDLNDVRKPESTMMDELARGQCRMWVTRCKIDDQMAKGTIRTRIKLSR